MPIWFVAMLVSYGIIVFGVFYLVVLMHVVQIDRANERRAVRFIRRDLVWPLLLIPWLRREIPELLALEQRQRTL